MKSNLVAQGYDLKRVSTYSLGAAGAMALKLQGLDDSLIMKSGQWTALTFLGALHTGLTCRMTQRIHFVNVAG
jgi:hypothetical protein